VAVNILEKSPEIDGWASDAGLMDIEVAVYDGGLVRQEEAVDDAGLARTVWPENERDRLDGDGLRGAKSLEIAEAELCEHGAVPFVRREVQQPGLLFHFG
jgi:hypothetical protein